MGNVDSKSHYLVDGRAATAESNHDRFLERQTTFDPYKIRFTTATEDEKGMLRSRSVALQQPQHEQECSRTSFCISDGN